MTQLVSELFESSQIHMANVSQKSSNFRRALAQGVIFLGENVISKIESKTMPKGDPLTVAEIAGINGAKNTAQTIPLCHPLPLEFVDISFEFNADGCRLTVYCIAATHAKTGVEMEALAGVSAALLSLYDLSKPVNPGLRIDDMRLLSKEGGKSGLWMHPDGIPESISSYLGM